MSDLVIVTDDGPVRVVRMNRPEKKNALTFAMYDVMATAIESAQENPAIRCLLIGGGGKTTSAPATTSAISLRPPIVMARCARR